MSLSGDSSFRYSSQKNTFIKKVARPAFLQLQKSFGFFPKQICLISGAPRSGTSALCEWLGRQRGVSAFPESRILVSIHRFMEEVHRFQNLDRDAASIVNLARHLVFDYYSSSRILIGKRLLVDKEPLEPIAFPVKDYGQFLVNIKKMFPEIKLILVVRDPLATIGSMSRRTWGESLTHVETRRFTIEEFTQNWCACAELISQYRAEPNTFIVQFGRLVKDPENESKRILDFLNLRKGTAFHPRQTNEDSFSNEEREKILTMVRPHLEMLNSQGIADLS